MKTKETKVDEDVKSVNEPEAAQTEMVVKKKLDIFNLFYSGASDATWGTYAVFIK